MTLRTLNYGNYGIFLIMGNAGFCPSTVVSENQGPQPKPPNLGYLIKRPPRNGPRIRALLAHAQGEEPPPTSLNVPTPYLQSPVKPRPQPLNPIPLNLQP